ncbi:aminopeptidase P family protein [Leuconostocaceae bacterium ESL0958]|nr:aminopeptidase P family protein [Leuconostocaceae bacterium ESL0958]
MGFFEQRIQNLQKLLINLDLDGLLIGDGMNMRYLTDFKGGTGDGLLLVSREQAVLITDARYENEYQDALPAGVAFDVTRGYDEQAARRVKEWGLKRLGFEASMPYDRYERLDDLMPINVAFDAVPGAVEALREVKDEMEVAALKRAAAASIKAFEQLVQEIKVGMTEKEVANRLDALQKEYGADKASFDTIVASGYRAALPHGGASDKQLAAGELVTIDFGYYVDGYTSDITRTIAMGSVDPELSKIYDIVRQANENALAVIKPGLSTAEVDRVARDYIQEAGYGAAFSHATGHGAGLDIHEGPVLSTRSSDELVAGNLLTVEPGIYLAGKGGVRIEDDVLVTPTGSENLTAALSKDLLVIDD